MSEQKDVAETEARDQVESAREEGRLAVDRAEEVVDRVAERAAKAFRMTGRQAIRLAALAQEEAEDVWVEAGGLHDGMAERAAEASLQYGLRVGGLLRRVRDRLLTARSSVQRELDGALSEVRERRKNRAQENPSQEKQDKART